MNTKIDTKNLPKPETKLQTPQEGLQKTRRSLTIYTTPVYAKPYHNRKLNPYHNRN